MGVLIWPNFSQTLLFLRHGNDRGDVVNAPGLPMIMMREGATRPFCGHREEEILRGRGRRTILTAMDRQFCRIVRFYVGLATNQRFRLACSI